MKKIVFLLCLCAAGLTACRSPEDSIAVIWTNSTDLITYCEAFNTAQDKYKITVSYKENPAEALIASKEIPDAVVGPWLKGEDSRIKFAKIDGLLSDKKINPAIFYPSLLKLGNVNGKQYLLPVSFNLPTIIFSSVHKNLVETNFTLSLDDIKKLAAGYNRRQGNEYTRMGFSPRWDMNFLYATAQGLNASFEETPQFFSWNEQALREVITYIRQWSQEVNTSAAAEDEFQFKYLYDPPYTLLNSGRCLFWYLPSNEFFSLQYEKLKTLDYRWMRFNDKTPLQDTIIYAGICKKAKNRAAVEAFLLWFFNEETQKQLLERAQKNNMIIPSFGLAGGFSSLHSVTENIFPVYYPLLLKHLPQTDDFSAPHILPANWERIKKDILFPYLKEQTALPADSENTAAPDLKKRIAEWQKKIR